MFKKLGQLFASVLGLVLLVYSATRSLDFISLTLPPDRQILAWFGLAALDGGLLAWLLAYLYGSHGGWQRAISLIMVVVDLLGAVAMFTLDTLYQTGQTGMTKALTAEELQTAVLGLSGVIALNIVATVAHHLTEPDKLKEQAQEEAFAKVEDATLKQISDNADQLAAEVAPMLAADWMMNTRARYLANLGTGRMPVIDATAKDVTPRPELVENQESTCMECSKEYSVNTPGSSLLYCSPSCEYQALQKQRTRTEQRLEKLEQNKPAPNLAPLWAWTLLNKNGNGKKSADTLAYGEGKTGTNGPAPFQE